MSTLDPYYPKVWAVIEKIKSGEKPTSEDIALVQEFIDYAVRAFHELAEAITEAFAKVARQIVEWFESLPAETRHRIIILSNHLDHEGERRLVPLATGGINFAGRPDGLMSQMHIEPKTIPATDANFAKVMRQMNESRF